MADAPADELVLVDACPLRRPERAGPSEGALTGALLLLLLSVGRR